MSGRELSGGVAVITGAGSGLGAAMAHRFATQGMAVVALDIDGERASATAEAIQSGGGRAMALQVDVADRASLFDAARRTAERFGSCSVLCANVGVQYFGAIGTLSESEWRWMLDVNVMGVINLIDAFLPLVRASGGRRHIVVTSSNAAFAPGIRMAPYTTTKYAVTGYAETLRLELAEEGIGVSILFPAGMATRHLETSLQARPDELGPGEIRKEDIRAMVASRADEEASAVKTPDDAIRHLLADLAQNRRYIITHGDCSDAIRQNFEELLDANRRAQVE
jgi:NAD(P)-dependent dehydrogenase (short-subunit alcohol dehydrogenase family)